MLEKTKYLVHHGVEIIKNFTSGQDPLCDEEAVFNIFTMNKNKQTIFGGAISSTRRTRWRVAMLQLHNELTQREKSPFW